MSWIGALVRTALMAGLAYYEWRRLVRDTGLRGAPRIAATVAIGASVTPIVAAGIVRGGGIPRLSGSIAWPGFLGWAAFALVFVGLVAVDAGRLVVWLARRAARAAPMDPSRRQALARITGGAVSALAIAEVGTGIAAARRPPPVVDVPIRLARLPRVFDGFTIVQLTDLHVGATIDRDWVASLVARCNALAPDLIALTGDLVDGSVDELRDDLAPLGELRARHGVYFVTGNHEYYAGVDAWIAYLRELGIRVLRNERITIERSETGSGDPDGFAGGAGSRDSRGIARGGAAFDLAGIDDFSAAQHAPGHGPDLAAALAGRDPARAVVLLAHQPRQVHDAAAHGVDLQLSGHTHGGQVWPWHYLVSLQQGGLIAGRHRIGPTELYISRGAGYWGPPVRFAAPSELTRVILRAG